MIKIGVIIPLYNKVNFIEKCLTSVQKQEYSNLDIIVVDDGSTDGSIQRVKEIENRDPRIKLILQSHNGVSAARNNGLKHLDLDTQYVVFVDADDFIKLDYISTLIKYKDYDLVVSGFEMKNDETNSNAGEYSLSHDLVVKRSAIADFIFNKQRYPLFSVVYTKLLKVSIIRKYNLYFDNQSFGEDSLFILNYMTNIRSMYCASYVGYVNRIVKNTLSRKYINTIYSDTLNIVILADKLFKLKYDNNWQYLYCRTIKLVLNNDRVNFRLFKKACINIKNSNNYKHLSIAKINDVKDKIFVLLFKTCNYYLLYELFNLKSK